MFYDLKRITYSTLVAQVILRGALRCTTRARSLQLLDVNRWCLFIMRLATIRKTLSVGKNTSKLPTVSDIFVIDAKLISQAEREASRARSDADFISKIELCAGEADEAELWLELLTEKCGVDDNKTQPVWDEADELISIFVTMSKNTKRRSIK
jgi:hypothetical protein